MGHPLKIAIIVPDNRDEFRRYSDPTPHFGTAPTALLDGFSRLSEECEVHIVSCVQQAVEAPEKIGPNLFYHTEIVPKWGWLRGGYLGCIRSVRRQLQRIQPDIVHGQGTERYAALAAVFSGFPNVLTIHGNMKAIAEIYRAPIGSFHWLTAHLESFALKRTAGVFCNSAYTEALVQPRTDKTWRVANALQLDFFKTTSIRSRMKRPVILNIGVMEPRKQQVELLKRAQEWHAAGLEFQLHFVGNRAEQTPYGKLFFQELAAAEAAGYARHLGLLSVNQIIESMDTAAALIHFPLEEAFGLVAAEALARNLKFFGAETGGIIDIARAVPGAELFNKGDWTGLTQALTQWIKQGCPSPDGTSKVMRERFHPEIIARHHLDIYRELIPSSKNGA